MTPNDREQLRLTLRERAWRILESGRRLVGEAVDSPAVRTDVEDASDTALLDAISTTRLDLGERDRNLLRQVGDALDRIRNGSYGLCVDCGAAIELPRLRAVPWAARCEDDQERFEQDNRVNTPTL
jgi:DnaK suppressor protein